MSAPNPKWHASNWESGRFCYEVFNQEFKVIYCTTDRNSHIQSQLCT